MSTRGEPACRAGMGRAALVALHLLCCVATARAQARADRWTISLGGFLGPPSGWVQVRENQLAGTRLDVRHDLGVATATAIELDAGYRFTPQTTLRVTLDSYGLNGVTTLSHNILFNGTTLEQGTVLATRTDFPRFIRVTVAGEWRLLATGGTQIRALAGLTAVLLTFRLHGTIAPSSIGHEPKEDFVTQELPVPLVGLALEHALVQRLDLHVDLTGGYLPRVNSLRREGGIVMLSQSHLDLDVGVGYAFARAWQAEVGYHVMAFDQNEQSHEDGNVIRLGVNAVRFAVITHL